MPNSKVGYRKHICRHIPYNSFLVLCEGSANFDKNEDHHWLCRGWPGIPLELLILMISSQKSDDAIIMGCFFSDDICSKEKHYNALWFLPKDT